MSNWKIFDAVYRRLLSEATTDLGDVQFSRHRTDGAPTNEPDTRAERKLHYNIGQWLMGSPLESETWNELRSLMSDPRYSDFFKEPPPGESLYRGMTLSREDLSSISGIPLDQISNSGKIRGDFTVPLRRKSLGASWTRDVEMAWEFANSRRMPDGLAVVWTATAGKNPRSFLDLDSIMQRASASPGWHPFMHEHEILAMKPIVAHGVMWRPLVRM